MVLVVRLGLVIWWMGIECNQCQRRKKKRTKILGQATHTNHASTAAAQHLCAFNRYATHRFVQFGQNLQLLCPEFDQIDQGTQLLTQSFGIGHVQILPSKIVHTARFETFSQILKVFDITETIGVVKF